MSKQTKPAIAAKITQPRVFTINGEEVTAIPGHYLVTYEDGELVLLNEDEFKSRFIRVPGSNSDQVLAVEDVNNFFKENPNGLVNGQDTTDKDGKPVAAKASEEVVEGLRTVQDLLDNDHEAYTASEAARADASLKVKEARERALSPKETKAAPTDKADKPVTGFGTTTDKPENETAGGNTETKATRSSGPKSKDAASTADTAAPAASVDAKAAEAEGTVKD